MLTLGQLKTGVVARIAASCTTSQNFLDLVNAAVRQLMTRGNWYATVQAMRFAVRGGAFVLPRFVDAVLAVNINRQPIQVANKWFDFEPFQDWHRDAARCCRLGDGWRSAVTAVSDGTTPFLNQIPLGVTNFVRFYVTQPTDYGKTITVYGLDANGQTVFSTFPDGTVQEGVILTLAQPYVQSAIQFSQLQRLVKSVTDGPVNGYLFDPNTNLLNDLGQYGPTDTLPDYVHMHLSGNTQACCVCNQISALVKLKYVPLVNDNDLVLVESEDAIRDMLMSIREKEAVNVQAALALETSAFRELNFQMKNRFPDDQFVVNFQPFGTANFQRVTGGFY